MEDETAEVTMYKYDLSRGLAKRISPALIVYIRAVLFFMELRRQIMLYPIRGKQIEGIWHTSIVVYGREYFFGESGISCTTPGYSVNGLVPVEKLHLGQTFIPQAVFEDFIRGLEESEFRCGTYHLLTHNCNNFSDTVAQFLVGNGIPSDILRLPEEILNTPFGNPYRTFIDQFASTPSVRIESLRRDQSPEFQQLNQDIEIARIQSLALKERRNEIREKIARRERKKNKKKKKEALRLQSLNHVDSTVRMSETADSAPHDAVSGVDQAALDLEEENREREERRAHRVEPIVFKDSVDVNAEFDGLVGLIDGKLTEEEQRSLEELHQYMLQDEGSWALGDTFLDFIGRLLTDKSFDEKVSVKCLNVLAAAALKDDVILMLHQDRRQHILMNYAYNVDLLTPAQQKALTLFICNLFENIGTSEWLLYISEWTFNNTQLSNIRVTTKVTVNALLSEDEEMKDRGSAIVYNLAMKEVFDDVAVELTMAVLQFLSGNPSETHVWRCLMSLSRFCLVAAQDVPQLVQMIGPHPSKFKGQSERVDEVVQELSKRIK